VSALRTALALAAALLTSACAVGPNYRTATRPPAAGPFVSAPATLTTAQAPAADWWRLYDDPLLDGLVDEALAHNRTVAAAAANLRQVRASLSESRAARLPSTVVTAAAERVRQPNPLTGQAAEGDVTSVGFQAAYEIDLFGRVGRSIEAARADTGAAEAAFEAAQVLVAAETARAYAQVCGDNVQIAVAQRTLGYFRQIADLTNRQLDAGRGTGLDVARAQAQVESARAAIPSLESDRDAALFRLSVLLGRPPVRFPAQVRACAAIPQVTQPIPVGDGATLLARRPDVRQAERRLAAATARIGVATADLFPSVSIGGSVNTIGGEGRKLGDNYQFSVGPLISWTFPNILAARARVRQASAAAQGALAAFDQANLTALQETETALTAYAKELDRSAALRRARDESARAVSLSHLRQTEGLDSFLTVLDAERTLATLEAQLAQSQALVAADQVALFKALGGGWPQTTVKP
jgi:NodT family efflux transporter outer membrane factor (OMF) lipoprotein